MTKPRIRATLLLVFGFVLLSPVARAATLAPTPSATPSPIHVNAQNEIFGLLILTAFAGAGYYVAKWIRKDRQPRPRGPWFGGWGR